ncbi:MAG: DUF6290 family protein [Promethearchaeota archaeon]
MSSKSDPSENARKKPKMARITVSLDDFDDKVIKSMAENRNKPLSEVLRYIITKYIEDNSNTIESKWGVNFQEISRQLKIESEEQKTQELIKKLVQYFKRIKSMEIDRISDLLDINSKTLVDLIVLHGDQLEKKGLNLQIDGELIIKEN